jgi:endo-1,4-beta-xylanase
MYSVILKEENVNGMDSIKRARTVKVIFICLFIFSASLASTQDTTTIRKLVATMSHQDSLFIGTAIHSSFLGTQTETIVTREFSYLTPANEFKQSYIHPTPDKWQWSKPDNITNYAQAAGLLMRLHAPISPQASTWARDDSRTPAELEQNLREYMTENCKHYNDSTHIRWLDVVNETLSSDATWFGPKEGNDRWENPWPIIGYDESVDLRPPLYIKMAFEIANEYAPDMKLIINQHGALEYETWEKMKELVFYLRDLGLRVDGLGWQAHNYLGWEDDPENLKRLADIIDWCHANELEFHITEFNVWLKGDDAGKLEEQAESFYAITKTVVSRYGSGVVGINFWHIRGIETQNKDRDGGLWANDYHPKPAYYDVKRALYEVENGVGPTILSVPMKSAIVGDTYNYQLELLGDIGELSYEISSDEAAPWLSIDENGLISGTPSSTDTINITLTVNDDIGPRMQVFLLIVYAEPLTITSTPTESATTEFLFEYQLTRTGGGIFSLETNEDADWLSLSEDGLLSGTPSEEQSLEVSIILSRDEDTVFQEWTLQVNYKLDILSKPITKAHEGKMFRYQLYYNGIGIFSLATDPRAEWLSIDENGLLSGTPRTGYHPCDHYSTK